MSAQSYRQNRAREQQRLAEDLAQKYAQLAGWQGREWSKGGAVRDELRFRFAELVREFGLIATQL